MESFDFFVITAYSDLHWFGPSQFKGRNRGIVTFEFEKPIAIRGGQYSSLACLCSADETSQTVAFVKERIEVKAPLDDFGQYQSVAEQLSSGVSSVNGIVKINGNGEITELSLKTEPIAVQKLAVSTSMAK